MRHTRDLQVAAIREGLEHCTAHQQECHSLVTDTMHRRRWQDKKFFCFVLLLHKTTHTATKRLLNLQQDSRAAKAMERFWQRPQQVKVKVVHAITLTFAAGLATRCHAVDCKASLEICSPGQLCRTVLPCWPCQSSREHIRNRSRENRARP